MIVAWILESFLGSWILSRMWRKSGIQQALREVQIPEPPTFQPLWPLPEPDLSQFDIEALDSRTRAAIAAHAVPGNRIQLFQILKYMLMLLPLVQEKTLQDPAGLL